MNNNDREIRPEIFVNLKMVYVPAKNIGRYSLWLSPCDVVKRLRRSFPIRVTNGLSGCQKIYFKHTLTRLYGTANHSVANDLRFKITRDGSTSLKQVQTSPFEDFLVSMALQQLEIVGVKQLLTYRADNPNDIRTPYRNRSSNKVVHFSYRAKGD